MSEIEEPVSARDAHSVELHGAVSHIAVPTPVSHAAGWHGVCVVLLESLLAKVLHQMPSDCHAPRHVTCTYYCSMLREAQADGQTAT